MKTHNLITRTLSLAISLALLLGMVGTIGIAAEETGQSDIPVSVVTLATP